jgi:hypothetical protein
LKLSASSRVGNDLAIVSFSMKLRVPTDVSRSYFLSDVSALKLRLERFKDISRSRGSESTPSKNWRKQNARGNCGFPVQNEYVLWRRVEKVRTGHSMHRLSCTEPMENDPMQVQLLRANSLELPRGSVGTVACTLFGTNSELLSQFLKYEPS